MSGVLVDARPAPVQIDPRTTAVVVVDMQHDFASVGGMFERAGIDIAPVRAIIEPTRSLVDTARGAGVTIVYLKMAFRPDLSDAGHPDSPIWIKHIPMNVGAAVESPTGEASRILIRDTWNTEIIAELEPHPDDIVMYKNRYSGFYDTELEAELRARGVQTIIFVGATTCVCVDSTVRDAMARNFHCIIAEDCVAEPIGADFERTNHDATLLTLQLLFASIADSPAVISALSSVNAPSA